MSRVNGNTFCVKGKKDGKDVVFCLGGNFIIDLDYSDLEKMEKGPLGSSEDSIIDSAKEKDVIVEKPFQVYYLWEPRYLDGKTLFLEEEQISIYVRITIAVAKNELQEYGINIAWLNARGWLEKEEIKRLQGTDLDAFIQLFTTLGCCYEILENDFIYGLSINKNETKMKYGLTFDKNTGKFLHITDLIEKNEA